MRHALSQVLHLDPHNGPEGYIVRSVYFDTLYDTDFYHKENGEELLSTLDDEAELEKIYELFMEQLLADEEENS